MSRRHSLPVSSSWTSSPPPSRTRRSSPNRSTSTRRRSMFRSPSISSTVIVSGVGDRRSGSTCTPCHAQTSVPSAQATAGPSLARGAGRGRRGGCHQRPLRDDREAVERPPRARRCEPARAGRRSRPRATRARRCRHSGSPNTSRMAASRGVSTSNWPGCIAWRASREVANAASVVAPRSAGWWRRTAHGRDRSRSCPTIAVQPSPRRRAARSSSAPRSISCRVVRCRHGVDGQRRRAQAPPESPPTGSAPSVEARRPPASLALEPLLEPAAPGRLEVERLGERVPRLAERRCRRRRVCRSRGSTSASARRTRQPPARPPATAPTGLRSSPLPAYRARMAASARGRSAGSVDRALARQVSRSRGRDPRPLASMRPAISRSPGATRAC